MARWTYRCYDNGQDKNLWESWYEEYEECQGSHDSVFEALEQQESWRMPHARPLDDGLMEVRLQGNVKWRVFGFFGGAQQEFVVVAVGNHKGPVYKPKNILKTAKKRMQEIQAGTKNAKPCKRPQ